jgi:hypothetical protein
MLTKIFKYDKIIKKKVGKMNKEIENKKNKKINFGRFSDWPWYINSSLKM